MKCCTCHGSRPCPDRADLHTARGGVHDAPAWGGNGVRHRWRTAPRRCGSARPLHDAHPRKLRRPDARVEFGGTATQRVAEQVIGDIMTEQVLTVPEGMPLLRAAA